MMISVQVHVNGDSHKAKVTVGGDAPVILGHGENRTFHPNIDRPILVEEIEADDVSPMDDSGGGGHDTPPAH